MNKRGQVTLFVILGIVIVAVIGIALYYKGAVSEDVADAELAEREALSEEERRVASLVDDCVERTLENAVFEISKNGGHYPPKEGAVRFKPENATRAFDIPIYYDFGKEDVPSMDDVRGALERYVNRNLGECLDPSIGMLESPVTNVKIQESLKAEVVMPVRVGEGKLKKFYAEVFVDYNDVMAQVKEFYGKVKAYNESVDHIEMAFLAYDNGYIYHTEFIGKTRLYFLFQENAINERTIVFPFGVRKDYVKELDMGHVGVGELEVSPEKSPESSPEGGKAEVDPKKAIDRPDAGVPIGVLGG